MARIISVNISSHKGTPKKSVEKIELKIDQGIVGDAHSGPGIRQVSLLAKESHDRFQPLTDVCLKNGIFGENLTTYGIDLPKLKIGQKLKINNCILEVSKIGKECHTLCGIGKKVGDCIMPKEGIFAKVIIGGEIKKGDEIIKL